MVGNSPTGEHSVVRRFVVATLGSLACLFGWACVLSFNPADPPSDRYWLPQAVCANWCGPGGAWCAYFAFYFLGVGVYPLLLLASAGIVAWGRGARMNDLWFRFVGVGLMCTVVSLCGALFPGGAERYTLAGPGGVLGSAAAVYLVPQLQTFGTLIVAACAFLVGVLLAADTWIIALVRGLGWAQKNSGPALARSTAAVANAGAAVASGVAQLSQRLGTTGGNGSPTRDAARGERPAASAARSRPLDRSAEEPVAAVEPGRLTTIPAAVETAGRSSAPAARGPETPAAKPASGAAPGERQLVVREVGARAAPRKEPQRLFDLSPEESAYRRPPLDLLDESVPVDKGAIEILCREKAMILEHTLKEFRLDVEVVAIETGPVITVFELKLAPGIKVSQIASLNNDMARALRAPAVRVVAPLPGKNTIGIEVPNIDKEKVRLKDIVELSAGRTEQQALPLYLGKDAAGQPLVTDLTRMPHLLIAGTTGSGKSVCVSSIVMSILMTRSPAEVQMILIDPKVVELAMYKDVPHLMCPIVTDIAKAEAILDWAATKMDERYALLAEAGVKDIRAYNRLGRDGLRDRIRPASEDELEKVPVHLPYILIVVDELADLMMTSAKEVEFYLCRIAQKSRAVGIHLIVSTQRPQANVVTGLIKSNLPCRIAFRVSSRLDSRIVLDQNGGEVLMGQGDMLFLPPGSSKLVRAQGTFISDDELRRTVQHCRQQQGQEFHPELVRTPGSGGAGGDERDELFDQAVDIILETGRGSVSLLQRRLEVGYGRASRLIDQMYDAGIVGEYKGSQAREVLLTRDEWQAAKAQRDREEGEEENPPV